MDYETLLTIQGYAKFFIILFVFVMFYGYAYSMYKRQKSGQRDFEKYSDLVLNDSIETKPLEIREDEKLEKGER